MRLSVLTCSKANERLTATLLIHKNFLSSNNSEALLLKLQCVCEQYHVMITLMNQLNRINTSFQRAVQTVRIKTCSLACYWPHSMRIRFSGFKIVCLLKYMQQSGGKCACFSSCVLFTSWT